MRVLIAYASRHHSTQQIAAAIARPLRAAGHTVDVRRVAAVDSVAPYDAVVLGSGIYNTHWLPTATTLAHRHGEALASRPLWLFSVGSFSSEERWPWGAMARGEPKEIAALLAALHPRDYHVFAGVVDPAAVGLVGRLFYTLLRGGCGDYRNWAEIDAWGRRIARDLADGSPSPPVVSARTTTRPG